MRLRDLRRRLRYPPQLRPAPAAGRHHPAPAARHSRPPRPTRRPAPLVVARHPAPAPRQPRHRPPRRVPGPPTHHRPPFRAEPPARLPGGHLVPTPRLHRLRDAVQIAEADLQQLRQLQHAGTPAVLLCPHLGNWEIANLAANLAGLRTAAVARKLPKPPSSKTTCAACANEPAAPSSTRRAPSAACSAPSATAPSSACSSTRTPGPATAASSSTSSASRLDEPRSRPARPPQRRRPLPSSTCTRDGPHRFRFGLEPVLPGGGTTETDEQIGQPHQRQYRTSHPRLSRAVPVALQAMAPHPCRHPRPPPASPGTPGKSKPRVATGKNSRNLPETKLHSSPARVP